MRGNAGGGVTQMTSAENPKINGYTQVRIYYHLTVITMTQYSEFFVGTQPHTHTTPTQESNKNVPLDLKVISNMENRKDPHTFTKTK
jgi:hypothetical protein